MKIYPRQVNNFAGGSITELASLKFSDPSTRFSQVLGAGTVYTLTTTAAAIAFGTTSPSITLSEAGLWLVQAQVQLDRAGVTVTNQTAALVLERTNNTAADLGNTLTIDLPVSTTLTDTLGVYRLSHLYQTTATNDAITIFGSISGSLGAGTLTAVAGGTSISAFRIS